MDDEVYEYWSTAPQPAHPLGVSNNNGADKGTVYISDLYFYDTFMNT